MAEFCESCPLRGDCTGEITGNVGIPIEYTSRAIMGYGALRDAHTGQVGVLVNDERQSSVPIKFPDADPAEILDRLTKRIDGCLGAVVETRGVFKKRTYATDCAAIGRLSIGNPQVRNVIQQQVDPQLI